jgi:hypothetical protein
MVRTLPVRSIACAVVASLALAAAAGASLHPAPSRPLTRDERLAIRIRAAEAIVVGRLVSFHDTTVTRGGGPGGWPMVFNKTRLVPERWLKGPGGRDTLLFCALTGQTTFVEGTKPGVRGPERSYGGARVIVFMSPPADEPVSGPETALGALQRSCRWVTGVVLLGGMDDVPDVSPADPAFVAEVQRGLSRQSSTAMARKADAIVLARVTNARPGGTHVDLRVDRALAGGLAQGARLRVELVAPLANRFRGWTGLFFLRRTKAGGYAALEAIGGILEVEKGRVPLWSMSLEEAEKRIARARETAGPGAQPTSN